jgi:hypothetical protein
MPNSLPRLRSASRGPNSLPPSPIPPRLSRRRTAFVLAALLATASASASAQILARPGYPGYAAPVDLWWKHAIFYQIAEPEAPQHIDFKGLAARLEALRTLGVDALLLPAPDPPAVGSTDTSALDDLDNLLRQASSHNIRVLVTLHAASAANVSGLARFWLSRGVAGLYIAAPPGSTPETAQEAVQTVRKLASSAAGQRIVISDLDLAPPTSAAEATRPSSHRAAGSRSGRSGNSAAQLQIDNRADRLPALTAANLRPLLAQTIGQPNLLLDLHPPSSPSSDSSDSSKPRPGLSDPIAAIALLTHPSAMIDSRANLVLQPTSHQPSVPEPAESAPPPPPPPAPPSGTYLPYVPYVAPPKPRPVVAPKLIPPDPLTTWYQRLAALHDSNAGVREGNITLLDFDAQNALVWVSRPASPSLLNPPVVVICNLSDSPVQLSLDADMKRLNLHGFFLRALLRSDQGMGAQDVNSVNIPAFGVYIGELRR